MQEATRESTPVPADSVIELSVAEYRRGHIEAVQFFCQDCAREIVNEARQRVADGTWPEPLKQGAITSYRVGPRREVRHHWIEVLASTATCYGDPKVCEIARKHAEVY